MTRPTRFVPLGLALTSDRYGTINRMPSKHAPTEQRKPRILHAPTNIAGIAGLLSRAQRDLGYDSTSVQYVAHKYAFDTDRTLNLARSDNAAKKALTVGGFALDAIRHYDVFHLYFGNTLFPYPYPDLPLLRALGKRIIFHFDWDEWNQVHKGSALRHLYLLVSAFYQFGNAITLFDRYIRRFVRIGNHQDLLSARVLKGDLVDSRRRACRLNAPGTAMYIARKMCERPPGHRIIPHNDLPTLPDALLLPSLSFVMSTASGAELCMRQASSYDAMRASSVESSGRVRCWMRSILLMKSRVARCVSLLTPSGFFRYAWYCCSLVGYCCRAGYMYSPSVSLSHHW